MLWGPRLHREGITALALRGARTLVLGESIAACDV